MKFNSIEQIKGVVEAILFASGQPVSSKKLAQSIEMDLETTQKVLDMLLREYREDKHKGIEILKLNESYQMCTKKEHSRWISEFLQLKRNAPLSQAAMEVLAIVAYNQPVSKNFIEEIRGVDCNTTMSSLVEKELIAEAGRFDLPGRPISYVTTEHFLRCFELTSLEDLPDVNQLSFTGEGLGQ